MFHRLKSKTMSMQDAELFLKENSDILLIDARTPEEYAQGHIPSSKNIPLGQEFLLDKEGLDKDTPMLVYCRSGARSSQSVKLYERLGFTSVTNIGGIIDWNGKLER